MAPLSCASSISVGINLRRAISLDTSPAIKSRCVDTMAASLLEFSSRTLTLLRSNKPITSSSVVFWRRLKACTAL